MSIPFAIIYAWERREIAEQIPKKYFSSWPIMYQELRRFLALYEGNFTLRIDGVDLLFDLAHDLPAAFERFPQMLGNLTSDTESPVELHFSEQGSGILLLLQRQGDTVTISFVTGPWSGQRFRDLPKKTYAVDAPEFFSAWVGFIRAILDGMRAVRHSIVEEESYQRYVAQLDALDSADNAPELP